MYKYGSYEDTKVGSVIEITENYDGSILKKGDTLDKFKTGDRVRFKSKDSNNAGTAIKRKPTTIVNAE
jgi:hypothetical protein